MEKEIEIELDDKERQKCEIWTRVMGYHRHVDNFDIGKQAEFKERVFFSHEETLKNL